MRSCSEKYLKEIGRNDDEISSLREGLALSYKVSEASAKNEKLIDRNMLTNDRKAGEMMLS
ncbi:MAG: hypothetical protein IKF90_07635 [Parasporobacterium sp.]|nr:hypothetical protein [Parasporobacterium sp.]